MSTVTPAASSAPKPIRSPSYPVMALRDAVDRVAKIERQYRSNPVDRALAAKVIGFSALSGPANKALAALAAYGLIEQAGKGEVRVTERARDILHAENVAQRRARLTDAALEPPLYREIRGRFIGLPVPPEEGVVNYLNRQGFNPNAVRPAANAFRETMSYLEELAASDSHSIEHQIDENKSTYGGAAVGDFIQWAINEVLQMEAPRRVRAVDTQNGKEWVFVDGSETGIPMDQVIVEKKSEKPSPNAPRLPLGGTDLRPFDFSNPPSHLLTSREVFPVDEGEVVLTLPAALSAESIDEIEARLKISLARARRGAVRREQLRELGKMDEAMRDLYETAKEDFAKKGK